MERSQHGDRQRTVVLVEGISDQRAIEEQLRRFMGTRGGRKILYGSLLVDALDLTRVPEPLDRLLAYLRA
jgi:hypothetical protein